MLLSPVAIAVPNCLLGFNVQQNRLACLRFSICVFKIDTYMFVPMFSKMWSVMLREHCVIVSVFLCLVGAREFVRITRRSEHGDLMNSAIGGFFSGALLGRLQGLFIVNMSGSILYLLYFLPHSLSNL